MSVRPQIVGAAASVNATARVIQNLAERHHVTYRITDNDRLAHHIAQVAHL
jgi:DNA topoisomerase IA